MVRLFETPDGDPQARICDVRAADRWTTVRGDRAQTLGELLITDPIEGRDAPASGRPAEGNV